MAALFCPVTSASGRAQSPGSRALRFRSRPRVRPSAPAASSSNPRQKVRVEEHGNRCAVLRRGTQLRKAADVVAVKMRTAAGMAIVLGARCARVAAFAMWAARSLRHRQMMQRSSARERESFGGSYNLGDLGSFSQQLTHWEIMSTPPVG